MVGILGFGINLSQMVSFIATFRTTRTCSDYKKNCKKFPMIQQEVAHRDELGMKRKTWSDIESLIVFFEGYQRLF
jgi:hypothetical protein